MTTLTRPGVPAGGFKTVGQIHATHNLVFPRTQNAMEAAVELLSAHTSGAPVVDERGEFIGFISEFNILRVLQSKKDLNQLTTGDVMAREQISVTNETGIDEALKIMEEKRLLSLPVKTHGKVTHSITRHDLLGPGSVSEWTSKPTCPNGSLVSKLSKLASVKCLRSLPGKPGSRDAAQI